MGGAGRLCGPKQQHHGEHLPERQIRTLFFSPAEMCGQKNATHLVTCTNLRASLRNPAQTTTPLLSDSPIDLD